MPLLIADANGRELGISSPGYDYGGMPNGAGGVPWIIPGPGVGRDEPPPPQPRDIRHMLNQDGKALQVSEALTLPLRAAKWKITGGDAGQADWTREWLGRLDPPLEVVVGQLAGASLFARALFEVVWDVGSDGRITPVRIAFRPTDNTRVVADSSGQPASLEQSLPGGETAKIPTERSLIYLHNAHRAPGVGVSDVGPVWTAHWEKRAIRSLWRIYLRRAAMPWTVATADQNHKDVLRSLASRIATIQSGGVVAVGPSEKVETLDAAGGAGAAFEMALGWCDRQMTQSIMAQFLDLGQGKVGSFALSKSHQDLFVQGREGVLIAIASAFTKHVVQRAVRANWPTGAPVFVFEPLSAGNEDAAATLLGQIATAPMVNPAIPAAFLRELVVRVSSVLGLDAGAIMAGLDTEGDPNAQMASAAQAATRVLAAALPPPAG